MENHEKLRELLDAHPVGAPKSVSFDKILRILFTEEEAKVAAAMVFATRSATEISRTSGVVEDEVSKHCESMADQGVIFAREKDSKMGYSLMPVIPGVFEFPFMSGGGTPWHRQLGKLWGEYHEEALGNEFAASETPFARVIPVGKSLDARTEVLPYEELYKMIDQARIFGLAQCACRVSVDKCDKPREVCLILSPAPVHYLVERKFAKQITKEEALEVLRRSEEAGLVHTTNNSQDRLNFVCNCCSCCCTILRGMTELKNPNAFARSNWRASVDGELCTACGTCEDERCPVDAIEVVDAARVDGDRCIGCGLCATACDAEAITMAGASERRDTPATIAEMGIKIANEKGKMEKFAELLEK